MLLKWKTERKRQKQEGRQIDDQTRKFNLSEAVSPMMQWETILF